MGQSNFIDYPRKYERVFSDPAKVEKRLLLKEVGSSGAFGGVGEMANAFISTLSSFEDSVFDFTVKFYWLASRFSYEGVKRDPFVSKGTRLERAFSMFIRNIVGHDFRYLMGDRSVIRRLATYLYELYPDFEMMNPMNRMNRIPFRNIWIQHMALVYQMDERMELLKRADDRGLNINEFTDYVLNWMLSYNETLSEDKYVLKMPDGQSPFVSRIGPRHNLDTRRNRYAARKAGGFSRWKDSHAWPKRSRPTPDNEGDRGRDNGSERPEEDCGTEDCGGII